jgi:diaminopimelate decarboxylase
MCMMNMMYMKKIDLIIFYILYFILLKFNLIFNKMFKTKSFPFPEKDIYELDLKYQTPFYIYDADSIQENCTHFLKTFRKYFPDFRNFFAVKALPNPSILKIINDSGMDFDASSPTELWLLDQMKINPNKIMYTSNYTSSDDLEYALENKVIINLDDIDGLHNLQKILSESLNLVSFRLNPNCGKTNSETVSNILGGVNSKFGISPENIINAYLQARKLGIFKFGLHCMTGSNILDIEYWKTLLITIYPVIKSLYDNDIELEFLNIGGGIGIPYKDNEEPVNIELLAKTIYDTISELNTKYNIQYKFKLYMECGRYITGPYGWLVTKCESIKTTDDKIYYGVNASMANLMRPGMYNAFHYLSTIKAKGKKDIPLEIVQANVVGTLCENNDWFAKNRIMNKVSKYDYIIFHDVGAHGHTMGFNYNGKLKSPEIMYHNNNFQLIRSRETPRYLYANCTYFHSHNIIEIIFIFFIFLLLFIFIY